MAKPTQRQLPGPDLTAIKQTLLRSAAQQSNNPVFQAVSQLIDGAVSLQGFFQEQFPQLDGNTSSLYQFTQSIIAELQERNNSKYCVKLRTGDSLLLPNHVATPVPWDVNEFDDGEMHVESNDDSWDPTRIRINHHGQWLIAGRVVFCSPIGATFRIDVKVNGSVVGGSEVTSSGRTIMPFIVLEEVLRNDIVTLELWHSGKTTIRVFPTIHLNRVSYVDKRTGRTGASFDSTACNDDGTVAGTEDCECELTGAQFAVLPQSKRLYVLNTDAKIISQTANPTIAGDKLSTFCPTRRGTFLVAIDDVTTGFTRIEERDVDGSLITHYDLPIRIGQGPIGAYHSLLEEPCRFILTVNRGTHKLTEFDLALSQVTRVFGLTINPFDGAINQKGNRLIYAEGKKIQCWDLISDQQLNTIVDTGFNFCWPTWLSDCSIIIYSGTYLTNGDFKRYSLAGALLKTYTYDASVFTNGLIGYAASKELDRLWIVGLDNKNKVTTSIYKLSNGSLVKSNVNWNFAPAVVNETAMVAAVYYPVACTITQS